MVSGENLYWKKGLGFWCFLRACGREVKVKESNIKTFKWQMIGLILVNIIFLSLNTYSITIDKNTGIVLLNRVNLRANPTTKSKVIAKLIKGDLFTTIKTTSDTEKDEEGWYKVKTKKGKVGWLLGKYCGINVSSSFYKGSIIIDIDGDMKKEIIWFAETFSEEEPGKISLVITNSRGQSFIYSFSTSFVKIKLGKAFFDEYKMRGIYFKELTGDNKLEIILKYYTRYEGAEHGGRVSIDIISLIKKQPTKILSLILYDSNIEECFYAKVKLEKKKITVSKVSTFGQDKQAKLEYVILAFGKFVYKWNNKKKKYILSSKQDKIPIYARSTVSNLRVRKVGNLNSPVLVRLKKKQRIEIMIPDSISPNETINGKKGAWLPVKLNNGTTGSVFSNYLKYENPFLQDVMTGEVKKKNYQFVEFK